MDHSVDKNKMGYMHFPEPCLSLDMFQYCYLVFPDFSLVFLIKMFLIEKKGAANRYPYEVNHVSVLLKTLNSNNNLPLLKGGIRAPSTHVAPGA